MSYNWKLLPPKIKHMQVNASFHNKHKKTSKVQKMWMWNFIEIFSDKNITLLKEIGTKVGDPVILWAIISFYVLRKLLKENYKDQSW